MTGRRYEVLDLGPESDRSLGALITDIQQTREAHALALEYGRRDDAQRERERLRVLEAELTERRDMTRDKSPRIRAFERIVGDPHITNEAAELILDEADAAEFGDRPLRDVRGVPGVPLVRLAGSGGALLSIGECLILSGEGGSGKSSLMLQLGAIGADANAPEWIPALGLEVARGPVIYASYEDSPQRVRDRAVDLLEADGPQDIPESVYIADMAGKPLFGPTSKVPFYDAVPGRLPAWASFWRRVRARIEEGRERTPGAGLVVLDPAAEAFTGDELRTTAVRQFLDSACIVCRALGCGLIVVAHPSKFGLARSRGRGAEAIAGTAAWHDASRGVLSLQRDGKVWTLKAEKANYGPSGDSIYLTRDGAGPFRLHDLKAAPATADPPAERITALEGSNTPPATSSSKKRCSPHRWRNPEVGDEEIVCLECGHRLKIVRLQPRMLTSMTRVRTAAGDPEFGERLLDAWRFAKAQR